MNYDLLRAELTADPLGLGYAALSDEQAAEALNTPNRVQVRPTFATWRTMLAALGPEATVTVKAKIDAAAAVNPAMALVADMLATYSEGGGLDLGHAYTRATIDGLVAAAVLTAAEATAIKAIAEHTMSRREELGLPALGAHHITEARS